MIQLNLHFLLRAVVVSLRLGHVGCFRLKCASLGILSVLALTLGGCIKAAQIEEKDTEETISSAAVDCASEGKQFVLKKVELKESRTSLFPRRPIVHGWCVEAGQRDNKSPVMHKTPADEIQTADQGNMSR